MALIAALVVGLAAPGVFAGTCAELTADLVSFPHCVEASPDYAIAWQTDDKTLWVALDLTTDDSDAWAGFGPSEAGGMKASDLWVVARTSVGGLAVHDLWSSKFGPPNPDPQQDVVLVAPLTEGQVADPNTPNEIASRLTEKPGRLRALLRRDLHACDARDLSITVGLPQPFVWAHGTGWPQYHGADNRGNLVLNMVPPEGEQPVQTKPDTLPPNTFQMEILMPNATIATDTTNSYICTHVQLTQEQKKFHITAQEVIIGNKKLLHHLVLFQCTGAGPYTSGDLFDCVTPPLDCSYFVTAWAPGADYVEFPKEAGFPFGVGAPEEQISSWFVLQAHYNNPMAETAPPDTSGLRLTYTSDLRPNDLGVLILGQLNLAIPGQRSRVVVPPNLCPGECTSRLEQPLTVIYTGLHMHSTGSSITTRHIRGDVELPPLGRRRVWDYNFQSPQSVSKETATVQPGDLLITQCVYNTVGRDNFTTFGERTEDEMCFNFLVGYPRSATVGLCTSNPRTMMNGIPVDTALCAPAIPTTDTSGLSPEEQMQALIESGQLVNATWPSSYSRYADPLCVGESVTPFRAP